MTFHRTSCLDSLEKLGPHLSEADARALLDRLAQVKDTHQMAGAEAAVLKALPAGAQQSYMDAKVAEWRAVTLKRTEFDDTNPVQTLVPAMSQDQRHQMLDLLLEDAPRMSEPLVAELLDQEYVDTRSDVHQAIADFLQECHTRNALELSHRLRELLGDDVQSVVPHSWTAVQGVYDLPRHHALGHDPSEARRLLKTEQFAKNIRHTALCDTERSGSWQDWKEFADAMKVLLAEVATQHTDFLFAYLSAPVHPDDPDLLNPGGAHAFSLLARELSTGVFTLARYLSDTQLHALLDFGVTGYDREILLTTVFTVATGPVFDRVLPLLDRQRIADFSSIEMTSVLEAKSTSEALQI